MKWRRNVGWSRVPYSLGRHTLDRLMIPAATFVPVSHAIACSHNSSCVLHIGIHDGHVQIVEKGQPYVSEVA